MSEPVITKQNIGRIAERIVANELEARGFRVSDLNKEGTAANADLLAVKLGRHWQIQVKGAAQASTDKRWWVGYGHCNQEHINDRSRPFFNQRSGFYSADIVVLVAVRSPAEYRCIVLPTATAEKAVQLNLDRYYRKAKRGGDPRKPGKVWEHLDTSPRERRKGPLLDQERELLNQHAEKWSMLD